jgi:hypothetical protein
VFAIILAGADGIFVAIQSQSFFREMSKIDRSMPIVAETQQILNRRNSPLNSRAEISDGSGRRFFVVRRKNLRR